MTQAELDAGTAAAESYEGWEAGFVGDANNRSMVALVIAAADAAKDQTAEGRQAAGAAALTKTIAAAGYGSEVSAEMIGGVVAAALGAIATVRASKK